MLLPALLLGGLLAPAPSPDTLADARAALEAGRHLEAERLLEQLTAADEQNLEARLLLAELLLERDAAAGAEVLELLDPWSTGDDPRVLFLLGRAFEGLGRDLAARGGADEDVGYYLGEARAHYALAADHAPAGDTRPAVAAGYLALYDFGDWRGALELADAALASAAADAEALLLRGCAGLYAYVDAKGADDAQAAEREWQSAVDDLRRAGELLGESRGDAWWQLAWLHEDKGDALAAVDAAVKHMRRTPQMDISRVYGLAKRYAAESRFDAANAALRALVERDPAELTRWVAAEDEPGAVAVRLGYAIGPDMGAGRFVQARELLEPLVAVDPANADIWNNYGLLCRDTGVMAERAGDTTRAEQLYARSYAAYERALELDPGNPQILNDTALVMHYHVRTDLERARELYRAAIEHAEALIEQGDERDEVRIALRDAKNNLALLGG